MISFPGGNGYNLKTLSQSCFNQGSTTASGLERKTLHDKRTDNVNYLIRTNFREALISRFSRFVKNREIKDSLKSGYAKIKHTKFNTLL